MIKYGKRTEYMFSNLFFRSGVKKEKEKSCIDFSNLAVYNTLIHWECLGVLGYASSYSKLSMHLKWIPSFRIINVTCPNMLLFSFFLFVQIPDLCALSCFMPARSTGRCNIYIFTLRYNCIKNHCTEMQAFAFSSVIEHTDSIYVMG